MEMKYGFQSGQMVISSHLLTTDNIKRSGAGQTGEETSGEEKRSEASPKGRAEAPGDRLHWKD
jgi:hypothetical protein